MREHWNWNTMEYQRSLKRPESAQGIGRGVKKSHSVVGGISGTGSGNVIGKFLKLGRPKGSSASTYGGDFEDEFRLPPSVLNRGLDSKMVNNSRKDVSRSHSWIYGSVKLPSDMPFGYGTAFGNSPSGSDSSENGGSHSHHHRVQPVNIPRCQLPEYYAAACECSSEFNFLPGNSAMKNGTCKACAYDDWILGRNKKGKKRDSSESGKNFVDSVKKLTWKSLKQVVKKRPSLDNVKKSSDFRVGGTGHYDCQPVPFFPMMGNSDVLMSPNGTEMQTRNNGFLNCSADDLQPSYFFPEKKNVYASCNDVHRDSVPYATASVRLRPKPSRPSWEFTNESGPVPNYHDQDATMYHSEWDLRQCIPYDVWVNTTHSVKPRTTMPPPRSKTPVHREPSSRNSSLSKSTSVPYLSEISRSVSRNMTRDEVPSSFGVRSSSSGTVNMNNCDTVSLRSVASTVKTSVSGSGSYSQRNTEGIVRRPSILATDIDAYQLNKSQGKGRKAPRASKTEEEVMSNSSDDLNDNVLNVDNHMRIAGQKIYMPSQRPALTQSKGPINIVSVQAKQEWTHDASTSTSTTPISSSGREKSMAHKQASKMKPASSIATQTSLNNSDYEIHDARSKPNKEIEIELSQPSILKQRNYYHRVAETQTQRDFDMEENCKVEFEEYIFEENGGKNQSKPHYDDGGVTESPASLKLAKDANNTRSSNNSVTNSVEAQEALQNALESDLTNSNKSNGAGKYGALRRRKSRNGGSNNAGKLLKEVIYEEEVEHDQDLRINDSQPLQQVSQGPETVKEYALKIVVSGTTLEYVKPILKNRERIYYDSQNYCSNSNDNNIISSNNSASHGTNNDDISVDSSPSLTSSSTLKKKVQFDHNRVIVCGGDSGPDSDDCGLDEDEPRKQKHGNYRNKENVMFVEEANDGYNASLIQNAKESGSNSSGNLKSNPSQSSALQDNKDKLSGNQSPEIRQKIRSTFEQEVAHKAASLALSRKNKQEAEIARQNTVVSVNHNDSKTEDNEDSQVNNLLPQQCAQDQSLVNDLSHKEMNNNSTKAWRSASSSQRTGSNHDPSQTTTEVENASSITKQRQFMKNSKASHGVAAQIMKAKRIANNNAPGGKSSVINDESSQKQKIINPNSLLFNDTTRIRLNQSRPSLNEAFKWNSAQNGSSSQHGGKGFRLKQSSSFRTLGSTPLRPKEPPPPPPPGSSSTMPKKNNNKSSPNVVKQLQVNLSSSIAGQLDKILTKTTANPLQLCNEINKAPSGPRLLLVSKSEISLPMDVQTTSNQVPRVIMNKSTSQGQKPICGVTTNNIAQNNNNNSNKGSGFVAKTSSTASHNDYNKKIIDSNSRNEKGSKSLANKCEILNKSAKSLNAKANGNHASISSNKLMNGKPSKERNAIGLRNGSLSKQMPVPDRSSNCENGKQNIEIVTKENAVSEIRIYSSTNGIVSSTNCISSNNDVIDAKHIHNNKLNANCNTNNKEIHYAATDVVLQKEASKANVPPRPPLPPIPRDQNNRPQSKSVVLIGDNNNNSHAKEANDAGPFTYSQPLDAVAKPKADIEANENHDLDEDNEEPLYDDVMQNKNKLSHQGSIGRKFLMASLGSMSTLKRQLSQSQDTAKFNSLSNMPDQVILSALPSLVSPPPSLPPPNMMSKSVSELNMQNTDGSENRNGNDTGNDQCLDEELDELYNDISSVGGVQRSRSLQSLASSVKGVLLSAIRNIEFDKKSSNGKDNDRGPDNLIYDDAVSLRSSNKEYDTRDSSIDSSSVLKLSKPILPPRPPSSVNSNSSTIKYMDNLGEQDDDDGDPIYDDVTNYAKIGDNHSSDSGAESEYTVPPPLPTQGPPKISTELPVLTFPLLMSKSEHEKMIDIVVPTGQDGNRNNPAKEHQQAVLTRTRTLLQELNEKLSELNNMASGTASTKRHSPLGFSSYSPTKSNPSSSSASSGVEEDYNSEKNYSLSNSSDGASGSNSADENDKIAQVTKLVAETITMARGKFLDSMKTQSLNASTNQSLMGSDNHRESGSSPCTSDEPIYEEIGDMNRSHSPIYADAFDAKSIFDGASKTDILTFLESIRDRLTNSESNSSGSPSSSINSKKDHDYYTDASTLLNDICQLTNDFGNDEPYSDPCSSMTSLVLRKLCSDCNDVPIGDEIDQSLTICNSCTRKRSERKEIITEIQETEVKYGRDLKIIMEEFYKPIQIAGLLNKEQLDQIFLNVGELMEISAQLIQMLLAEIQAAVSERKDDNLLSVNIGKIFLEIGDSMMTAFQAYCTRQANAGQLLANLEKEKELLGIFLRVSQMENLNLRRMNLQAFLMVPVQRVTRYPLLLCRLLKVTPMDHFCRDELQSAHEKIEQHLDNMNKATHEVASSKLWRRISIINGNSVPTSRRASTDFEGVILSIRKIAIGILDWANLTDVTCVMDNPLGVFNMNGKPMRGVYGCLLVRGKNLETLSTKIENDDMFFPPIEDDVKEVKLILVKMKNNRLCPVREPLCLSKCVVSQGEHEFQDFVEINEITTKQTYHLQGLDKQATANWLKYLQCYSMCVGQWRKRRGALANIMMNGMLKHL